MHVAELIITESTFSATTTTHVLSFESIDSARAEYERVAGLIKDEAKRKNDKPPTVEVIGDGNRLTLPLDNIRSVGLVDFAKANEQQAGVRDAFPNLFKR